jgi:hypothetical protein
MPVEIAPNRIELSQLLGGFAPDPEEVQLPLDHSPDVLNLLPDPGSGSLELRKGFARLSAGRIDSLSGTHYIRHVNYYEVIVSGARKRYLVCVLTSGTDAAANNVQIWVYDLVADTFTRVDTVGRSWSKAKTEHWFAIVEGTYYGGTRGEVIYSWHPTTGWDADPTTPDVREWQDDTGNSIDTATEYGKNFAFKKGLKTEFNGKYYSALRGIRFKTWEVDERYNKGERVSRKVNHGSSTYWRSFECIKTHTSSTVNRPGDGSGTPTDFWKNVKLKNIKDEDGDITSDWAYMPLPGKGVVGVYHGNRLWVRHDDSDNWARLQYSAPAKPEKDTLISDLDFRPTDWAPVDDNEGDGGGWFTVPFAQGDAIRALYSMGSYLIICGRWESFVLSGTNEQTWTLRPLGKMGCIGPNSIAEHNGTVFFLSPTGELVMTDGTSIQVAPGFEKVREWVKLRTDLLYTGALLSQPSVVSYGGFVVMSMQDDTSTDYTLVYHPDTASFWLWDIPMRGIAVGQKSKANRLYFSNAVTAQAGERPCVYQLTDDPGNEAYVDDDADGSSASAETNDITFRFRTGWFQFGVTRNERRLRRLWALVSGETGEQVTVATHKNFEEGSDTTTVDRTLVGSAQGEFIEGKVGQTNVVYALGVKVSGTANAALAIHGVGIDTEPQRPARFHV